MEYFVNYDANEDVYNVESVDGTILASYRYSSNAYDACYSANCKSIT